jgi:hypothetical protein
VVDGGVVVLVAVDGDAVVVGVVESIIPQSSPLVPGRQ